MKLVFPLCISCTKRASFLWALYFAQDGAQCKLFSSLCAEKKYIFSRAQRVLAFVHASQTLIQKYIVCALHISIALDTQDCIPLLLERHFSAATCFCTLSSQLLKCFFKLSA